MSVRGWAVAAACCALAAPALAQKAAPGSESKPAAGHSQPAAAAAHDRSWPKVLPNAPAGAKPQPELQWTAQEIALAQARCTARLKGIDAVAVPEAPIREGAECGAPAPMKLVSVGRNPPVAFSPPPIVTCDMIAALSRWLERDVQPLARKRLGAPVIRIETMSSYSCRNAYGRPDRRLSQHGLANALDISAFVTARGQTTFVLADWGPTAREIAEQNAIAKAEIERAASESAARFAVPQVNAGPGASALAPATGGGSQSASSGVTLSIPGLSINVPGLSSSGPSQLGMMPPSRLGGPKPVIAGQAPPPATPVLPDTKTQFLHAIHDSACKIFGTVLGPEANKAHRNHFHVDMAERIKNTRICE